MSKELGRFQHLLRELFQFDSADLDFGIYRILNARRDLFEDWIENRLPEKVSAALSSGAVKKDAGHAERMAELAAQLREEHEDDAVIDGDGHLRADIKGKTAKEYRVLWQALRENSGTGPAASEAEIYNRLYDFFHRYYDDGDFLSLRRYGADNAYSVPYNGEEALLHWANKDQYYIKTGEHFTDYRFRAGDKADAWHVEFKLARAESDRDNVKANEKRFFFFDHANAVVDSETRTLLIPVVYRTATTSEAESLGSRNQQEALNDDVAKKLLGRQRVKAQPALATALAKDVSNEGKDPKTLLARHLRRYTRRNTSDFFIHKDLSGFLTRELDYWLKAEVLKLDALLAGGEQAAQAWLHILGCLREVAGEIIVFLASIEEFQKRLYEKRKFVTECHWCITLDHVERAGLMGALVKVLNETEGGKLQKAEWKHLFAIEEVKAGGGQPGWKDNVTAEFLRSQPCLVVDTVHMPVEFTDALLGSFRDLEAQTSGVVFHSENWQALNLLMERYREQVRCIYIDPPYNTELDRSSGKFLYKDGFARSSWLALLHERLLSAGDFLTKNSPIYVSIDEHEFSRLDELMANIFSDKVGISTWVKKAKGSHLSSTIRDMTEFVLAYSQDKSSLTLFGEEAYADKAQPLAKKTNKAKVLSFPARKVETTLPDGIYKKGVRGDGANALRFHDDFVVKNHVVTNAFDVEGPFVWGQSMLDSEIGSGSRPLLSSRFGFNVLRSGQGDRFKRPTTLLNNETGVGTNETAFSEFTEMFGYEPRGMYPKPTNLIEYIIRQNTHFQKDGIVLDFFAGTGTTAHATINLNSSDKGARRFVLAEMGDYFDSILVPRLKKISYSVDWAGGKPVSRQGRSMVFKYARLESYEDTLNNLLLPSMAKGQAALNLMGDPYRLGYWLTMETQGSDSLLNIDKLEAPFEYSLAIHSGKESTCKPVNLPETFAYLMGLIIEGRSVLDRDGRRYLLQLGRQRAGDVRTAVLWRDIRGWQPDEFDAERLWLANQALFDNAAVVYVNGDSAIEGAQSLDSVFYTRMFAPVR